MATTKEIATGIAKLFLLPENIEGTVELLTDRHKFAVKANNPIEALAAAQLLTAVQKLADRQKKDLGR